MRVRTILILVAAVVVAGLVVVSMLRGGETLGGKMVNGLEKKGERLRGAVMVMDYKPDGAEATRVRSEAWRSGEGSGPGMLELSALAGRRWLAGDDFNVSWRPVNHAVKPALYAALSEPEVGQKLRRGLEGAGFVLDRPRELVEAARESWEDSLDEQLLLAWMRADRGVLQRLEEPSQVTREALLLLVPAPGDPVLTFEAGGQRVYMWPIPGAVGECAMSGFNSAGDWEWEATIFLRGAVAPERVRVVAYGVAERIGEAK